MSYKLLQKPMRLQDKTNQKPCFSGLRYEILRRQLFSNSIQKPYPNISTT